MKFTEEPLGLEHGVVYLIRLLGAVIKVTVLIGQKMRLTNSQNNFKGVTIMYMHYCVMLSKLLRFLRKVPSIIKKITRMYLY